MSALRDFYELAKGIVSKTIPNYVQIDRHRVLEHDSTLQDVSNSWVGYRIPSFARQMREFVETKVRPESPQMVPVCMRWIEDFADRFTDQFQHLDRDKYWNKEENLRSSGADWYRYASDGDMLIAGLAGDIGVWETDEELDKRSFRAQQQDLYDVYKTIGDVRKGPYIELERHSERATEKAAHERAKQEWAERRQREEEEEEAKKKLSGGGGGFRSTYRQWKPYRQPKPYRVSFF